MGLFTFVGDFKQFLKYYQHRKLDCGDLRRNCLISVCVVGTRRGWRRLDCSVTSVMCLIFTTPTTVHSKTCRPVRQPHNTGAVATTTGLTAAHVKVCVTAETINPLMHTVAIWVQL